MDLNLTKRQQEIFDFIKRYSAKYGYPPTVRDIGKAIGLTSSSTVHAHLSNLEKAGLLRRDPTKPRAIELLIDRAKRVKRRSIPAAGRCRWSARSRPAQPVLAEENIEDYVQVPDIAGGDEGEYILAGGRRLDDQRRHPRRRPRGRALAGDGHRRRHRRGARRRFGGHRQALLPGGGPHPPPAGERRCSSPSSATRSRCSGGWSASSGGSREHRGRTASPARSGDIDRPARPGRCAAASSRPLRRRQADARAAARARMGGPAPPRGRGVSRLHGRDGRDGRCRHAAADCRRGATFLRRLWHAGCECLDSAVAGQAAAGAGEKTGLRGKSGHRRAGWSGDRPGETRGKVPQKHTA